MKNWIWILIILAVLLIALIAANIEQEEGVLEENGEENVEEENGEEESLGAREVDIVMGDAYYQPYLIEAEVGEELRFNLDNQGSWQHDLVINELDVDSEMLNGGESGSVEFVAEEEGVYTFYCSVPSHREMGQIGHLVVGDYSEKEIESLVQEHMDEQGDEEIAKP